MDKMFLQPSYFHKGILYTAKTAFLRWNETQILCQQQRNFPNRRKTALTWSFYNFENSDPDDTRFLYWTGFQIIIGAVSAWSYTNPSNTGS